MTPFLKIACATVAIACLVACQRSQREDEKTSAKKEELALAHPTPSTYKDETHANGKRSFIRTADMKFRVNDVAKTTFAIEQLVVQAGGFVTKSHLETQVENSTTVQVSEDSSLRTIQYTVENTIQLRVPDHMLDSTLHSLAPLAGYLDFRRVDADDVALRLLAEKMRAERGAVSRDRLSRAVDRGGKLRDITEAEQKVLDRQEAADEAKISGLSLQDQVDFSTVTLVIYQPSVILKESVAFNKRVEAWRPGFGTELKDSFLSGWYLLESVLVFLAGMWGLILIFITGYLVYRLARRKLGPARVMS